MRRFNIRWLCLGNVRTMLIPYKTCLSRDTLIFDLKIGNEQELECKTETRLEHVYCQICAYKLQCIRLFTSQFLFFVLESQFLHLLLTLFP